MLSGKTQVYGLLGDPVSHSLSPCMQNRAFHEHNIDAVYVAFQVAPKDLTQALAGLRALNIAGVNVTVPHKEAILPLLDRIDPTAGLIGAVNTVVNRNGVLEGYNTDASGFIRALNNEQQFSAKGKRALLLGAGGASRAAIVALATARIKSITIANRRPERARHLTAEFSSCFPGVTLQAVSYEDDQYIAALSAADLIVNATAAGLDGEEINFLPLECIKGGALIYDMLYSLSETPLIKMVRSFDLLAADGLGMLAAQGEDAFTLWTGVRPKTGFMRQVLEECRSRE